MFETATNLLNASISAASAASAASLSARTVRSCFSASAASKLRKKINAMKPEQLLSGYGRPLKQRLEDQRRWKVWLGRAESRYNAAARRHREMRRAMRPSDAPDSDEEPAGAPRDAPGAAFERRRGGGHRRAEEDELVLVDGRVDEHGVEELELVLRERARLVAAEDVHAAELLDRGEPREDRLLLRERPRTPAWLWVACGIQPHTCRATTSFQDVDVFEK